MAISTGGVTYRVADAHAHIYKEKIAAKASRATGSFYDWEMYSEDATAEGLIRIEGAGMGVDRFLVFSVATTVPQVESINRFIAEECAAHAEFIGLGTAHQDVEDFGALVAQVQELGLAGIKLHPDIQRFNLDDSKMMPLYRRAAEAGLVMLFHVGDERYDYSAPERLARVLDAVPDLRVHAAHFGCCRIWERRPLVLAEYAQGGANIVFDTSSMLEWATVPKVRELIGELDADRIMWGTDFPMWNPRVEFDRLMEFGFPPEQTQAILYDNFGRFYRILE
jgi:predicted TIM-barrel fold metal-dependent hydrolase